MFDCRKPGGSGRHWRPLQTPIACGCPAEVNCPGESGRSVNSCPRFDGFDRNDTRERRLLGYVHYLVGRGRWAELKPRLAKIGDNGNSHSPRLPSCQRMLAAYTPIYEQAAKGERGYAPDAGLLTVDELNRVAEAWALRGRS